MFGKMRWIGAVLLTVTLLATWKATATRAQIPSSPEGQKWALLIGVDTYDRSDISPLRFAVADVHAVADALCESAGFPRDHVFVLTSDEQGDRSPTKGNVVFRLGWLADQVKPGDTVVVFFAGHGMDMEDSAYLLTREADARNAATLEETGLDSRILQKRLEALKAQHLLLFVDACRNDPRSGRGSSDNLLGQNLSRSLTLARPMGMEPVSATIFACKPGQRSYEWTDNGHGFFSYYLVAALRGKAADADGRITADGLWKYLDREVPRSTRDVLGVDQQPWMRSEGSGLSSWTLATVTRGDAPMALSAAPIIRLTSPSPGFHTTRASIALGATINGKVSDVTVMVNAHEVKLEPASLKMSAQGALVTVAVPLDVGENSVLVQAIGAAGVPAQAAVTVYREGDGTATKSMPAPVTQAPEAATARPIASPAAPSAPSMPSPPTAAPVPAATPAAIATPSMPVRPAAGPTPTAASTPPVALTLPATASVHGGGHAAPVSSVTFTPDGHTLASASVDGQIKMWDVDRQQLRNSLTGPRNQISQIAFRPDGKLLAIADNAGNVKLWDMTSGQESASAIKLPGGVWGVAWSPDGRLLATANSGRRMDPSDWGVELWNAETVKRLAAFHHMMGLDTMSASRVAFTPDGREVAMASWDTVTVFNVGTHKQRLLLGGDSRIITDIAISPDGHILAASYGQKEVCMWELAHGTAIRSLPLLSQVNRIAFSPDSLMLAAACDDGMVKLWEVASGNVLGTLVAHHGAVRTVAFSPDGKTIATAGMDRAVKLFDVATHRLLATFAGTP